MKRYVIFAGANYYPGGGWEDYLSSQDSIEDCLQIIASINIDWWQIVDITIPDIVKKGRKN